MTRLQCLSHGQHLLWELERWNFDLLLSWNDRLIELIDLHTPCRVSVYAVVDSNSRAKNWFLNAANNYMQLSLLHTCRGPTLHLLCHSHPVHLLCHSQPSLFLCHNQPFSLPWHGRLFHVICGWWGWHFHSFSESYRNTWKWWQQLCTFKYCRYCKSVLIMACMYIIMYDCERC